MYSIPPLFKFNPYMSQKLPLLSLFLSLLLLLCSSSDPDPVQDFCIPEPGPGPVRLTHLPTYPCKSPANVTSNDFVFSNLTSPPSSNFSPSTGFSGKAVTPVEFPALHTLGMSFARADFLPSGVNPPHYHPRATETALVVEGTVYSGFVDSGGRIFAKVLEKGEVMVFPRGMIHFQMNVGEGRASIFGTFNSENPGLVRIPGTVFGSGIKEELLEKAFGLSEKELERLRRRFGSM
ncbi:germin-like protein 2-4 [Iris pallida]|uniref:Germin-like protein n=1 Tax=Iris pallida TaxID=29817 RepID=A0AAX6DGW8_IRIPA|nr:germin-like protein 2-4 [Iris pallida]